MATRGHLGGLARATADAALVLDASGRDIVVIETVGVGQDEVDIVRTADVSVVTLVPGTGDDVQALKAGIMEIADVFVVNKADRDGADRLVSSVESNLSLHAYGAGDWRPPIVKTVATTGDGVPDLMDAIARFREHAKDTERPRRRARAESRLREIVSGAADGPPRTARARAGRADGDGGPHRGARARSLHRRGPTRATGLCRLAAPAVTKPRRTRSRLCTKILRVSSCPSCLRDGPSLT